MSIAFKKSLRKYTNHARSFFMPRLITICVSWLGILYFTISVTTHLQLQFFLPPMVLFAEYFVYQSVENIHNQIPLH
jgi:hypothetical protein